jgi:hypothetical protein
MAYSTASPPRLVVSAIGSTPQDWSYTNTDADSTVYAAGYISNGQKLGMRKGDRVAYYKSDTPGYYLHLVVSLSTSDSSVTLSSTNVTLLS